jgi:probable addiction module antidote protein
LLNEALASNDLQRICQAVDAIVIYCGVTELAKAAALDRTTLYRSFRMRNGPSLDTASKVFRALGLQLVVTLKSGNAKSVWCSSVDARKYRHEIALRFTRGLINGDTAALVEAYQDALTNQENTAKLATQMGRRREHLYRIFSRHPNPRFGTILSFLNALGLRFTAGRLSGLAAIVDQ